MAGDFGCDAKVELAGGGWTAAGDGGEVCLDGVEGGWLSMAIMLLPPSMLFWADVEWDAREGGCEFARKRKRF